MRKPNDFPYPSGTMLAILDKDKHLHVICTSSYFETSKGDFCVISVPISSIKMNQKHDPSCVLNEGDHPFIRHRSNVVYNKAVPWRIKSIKDGVISGDCIVKEDISPRLFKKVINGFQISTSVSRKLRKKFLQLLPQTLSEWKGNNL